MQCHQPLFGIGYPTPGQCPPVHPFNGGASDIIGEGEVTAVSFPDGTIQYYFMPVRWIGSDYYAKRWPPYPFSDPYCNSYNRPSSGAWIITKISNTISPVFNHCYQRSNPDPFPKPFFNYDCNVNTAPGFQLKFHNDCCTSTTDLHYFCPTVWKPVPVAVATTRSATVQVETPTETKCSCHTFNSSVPRNSAQCTFSSTKEYNNKKIQCKYKQIEKKPSSSMSIDKSKTSSSSCLIKKSKSKQKKHKKSCSSCSSCYESKRATKKRRKLVCDCDSQKNSLKAEIASSDQNQPAKKGSEINSACAPHTTDVDGQKLSKKKKSQMDCYCDAQSIADKTVATYTDQASSVKEVEGQTQTKRCLDCSCSTLDVKRVSVSQLWIPKRITDPQSSEKILGVYETSSSESNISLCSNCRTSRDSFK